MARKGKSAPAPPAGPEPLPPELLEAIAQAPADDVPRLVAADWFAEHGQPERAELIALQCQLERLEPASPEREPLDARVRAMLRSAPAGWRATVPNVELGWVRGFPGSVVGEPGDILAAAPQLAALSLPLERMTLTGLSDTRALERLVQTPLWAGIRVLHLAELGDRSAPALLESGALAAIEHLLLERASDLDRHAWTLLARRESVPRLRSLRLLRANASAWCRASPSLPALELLGLEEAGLNPEDLKALARSDVWPRLRTLGVLRSPLATEGAAAIAAKPAPGLQALDLSWCRLGAAGLRALCQAEGLSLRILKLRYDALAGTALEALLDAPLAQTLEWLDVRGNSDVDPATLKKLKARWNARLLA